MEEMIKKSAEAVKNMFGKEYNPIELDNLVVDTLDLFIYRFIRNDLTMHRHSSMTGTDLAEYKGVLQEAERVIKTLEAITETIEGKKVIVKEEYDIYEPLKGLFQYLFTNYNLDSDKFKRGIEFLMENSFQELISILENMIFNYLKTFYYVVSKRYYYVGSTTQIVLDGLRKNEKAKALFEKIASPEILIKKITEIVKTNNYKNLANIILHLFESFYKNEKAQLEVLFPIKEIEFNDTDVELLLGEGYLTKTLDENMITLNKGIKSLIDNKDKIFLNDVKNENIEKFSDNMGLFTQNLKIFMSYFCDNFEVFTKTILISFKKVFKGIAKDPIIIPDFIDVKKSIKIAEASKKSLNVKAINRIILTQIIDTLRRRLDEKTIDNILLSSFNIIFSVLPYYKLVDILAELKFSKKMLRRYFNNISSLIPSLNKALEKINVAQSIYAETSRFKLDYMSQFDVGEEEEGNLEDREEIFTESKKVKFETPEKVSPFENQTMDKTLERGIKRLIRMLTFIAILIQNPRKTEKVEYSKELFEEWYEPILEEKGFKNITKNKIKHLLMGTNMVVSYSKILGTTSILTITGKRDYFYLKNYREYLVKRAFSSNLKNAISEDLLKELSNYLAGGNRMLRDFFEVGKVHVKEFIKNIENINNVKTNEGGWASHVKRFSDSLNKALEVLLRDISDMSGQGILNTILVKAGKEFESLEKNYIVIVNDVFFHSLIDKL